jgi:hypothetical protein
MGVIERNHAFSTIYPGQPAAQVVNGWYLLGESSVG